MDVLTANSEATHVQVAAPRFDRVRILADDLTGACDSAAAFLAGGHEVRVWLGPVGQGEATESVQAFNTASRGLEADQAAEAVSRAAAAMCGGEHTLWFKKVDSAGRGAIAAEVLAAHEALGTRAILFAPSFPAAGRTVRGGVLRVCDASGIFFEIPLGLQFQGIALTANISEVSQIIPALAAKATVLVCDASTQGELEKLAAVDEPGLLYAGSAGFAKALASVYSSAVGAPKESVPRAARAMTICGSPHRVTQMQMAHLADKLPDHQPLHVAPGTNREEAVLKRFERHDPQALILTGGDTALLALTALGANSILLRGELADGIPWGVVQGGLADGRIVITKSGGFGTADSLTQIVRQLTGEISE